MKIYEESAAFKQMLKVSAVVAVYNVEAYLNKCLDSIAKQTMNKDEFEVIIINDGSTDGSCNIAESYVEKYSNFRLIEQENSGLSSARNTGLDCADGEYIVFIDGDDFLEPSYLEELYTACIKNNAEISYCNYYKYFPERDMKILIPNAPKTKVYEKEEALKIMIKDIFMRYFAWNKMFKRSIFTENNLRFPDMYFEDIATTPKAFYFANKVTTVRKALYNYTKRKNSILQTMDTKKINDYINAFGEIRNFLEKQDDFEAYKYSMIFEAIRCKLCNYYSIIKVHISTKNMKGLAENIKNSNKSLTYFSNDEFKINCKTAKLPYPVQTPENKNVNKLNKINKKRNIYERQKV